MVAESPEGTAHWLLSPIGYVKGRCLWGGFSRRRLPRRDDFSRAGKGRARARRARAHKLFKLVVLLPCRDTPVPGMVGKGPAGKGTAVGFVSLPWKFGLVCWIPPRGE